MDAYYIPEEDGSIKDLFIYQNGKLIDRLVDIGTFNTATAEQTEEDKRIMGKQVQFGKAFDRMMQRDAVTPVGIMKKETAQAISATPAKAVENAISDENDFLNYDVEKFRFAGRASV